MDMSRFPNESANMTYIKLEAIIHEFHKQPKDFAVVA